MMRRRGGVCLRRVSSAAQQAGPDRGHRHHRRQHRAAGSGPASSGDPIPRAFPPWVAPAQSSFSGWRSSRTTSTSSGSPSWPSVLLYLLYGRTSIGWKMQAVAQDAEAARLMGINVELRHPLHLGTLGSARRSGRLSGGASLLHHHHGGLRGHAEGVRRLHHRWVRQPSGGDQSAGCSWGWLRRFWPATCPPRTRTC